MTEPLTFSLEPKSHIPLYEQLSQQFRQAITSNKLPPGTPIIPENELVAALGISRITVRKAFSILEEEGLVVRRQGKGTFVAPKVIVHDLQSIHTLSEIINEQSQSVVVELLERSLTAHIPQNVRAELQVLEGGFALLLRRLHIVEGIPVVLASIYLRAEFEPVLRTQELLSSSVYELLRLRLGISVAEVRESISVGQAEESVAKALQIGTYSPVLIMESIGFDASGRSMDHTTFFFRPDRYKFTVRIAKPSETKI